MPSQPGELLIGREAELAVLQQAIERALSGHESWLMVGGEPGIGKTHFARQAAALAEKHGVRALWGRCSEDAGAPPFLPWTRALEAALNAFDAPDLGRQRSDDAAQAAALG